MEVQDSGAGVGGMGVGVAMGYNGRVEVCLAAYLYSTTL